MDDVIEKWPYRVAALLGIMLVAGCNPQSAQVANEPPSLVQRANIQLPVQFGDISRQERLEYEQIWASAVAARNKDEMSKVSTAVVSECFSHQFSSRSRAGRCGQMYIAVATLGHRRGYYPRDSIEVAQEAAARWGTPPRSLSEIGAGVANALANAPVSSSPPTPKPAVCSRVGTARYAAAVNEGRC